MANVVESFWIRRADFHLLKGTDLGVYIGEVWYPGVE